MSCPRCSSLIVTKEGTAQLDGHLCSSPPTTKVPWCLLWPDLHRLVIVRVRTR
jgi:hypothetical protein